MRRANDLVRTWMRDAGMAVREDAIGNLIGYYAGESPKPVESSDEKVLLLGSHLDSVRDAGKFDGPLGVLTAIACVEHLNQEKTRLPFAIQVLGFCDEEGVRYQSAYLGSKVLTGAFNPNDLMRVDAGGITMAEAIRSFGGNPDALDFAKLDPDRLLGYAEIHIEQGPILEQKNLPLGVVTAIAGQTRARLIFTGCAGHAGTVPMNLRRDALCAAAEFILAVEDLAQRRGDLVATVGEITAVPGASNVIPGEIRLSLDVRHPEDAARQAAVAEFQELAGGIAQKRKLRFDWQPVQETAAVACDTQLSKILAEAVRDHQKEDIFLHSGAGHDAAVMASISPVTMLFVRCKGGLSHHPDEFASLEDIRAAIAVMNDFIHLLADNYAAKDE